MNSRFTTTDRFSRLESSFHVMKEPLKNDKASLVSGKRLCNITEMILTPLSQAWPTLSKGQRTAEATSPGYNTYLSSLTLSI